MADLYYAFMAQHRDRLTVAEGAEFLGLPVSTVYDLVRAKKLPHYRMGVQGGAIRLDRKDLESYLATSKQGPKEATRQIARSRRFLSSDFVLQIPGVTKF